MKNLSNMPVRKNIRLQNYNYSIMYNHSHFILILDGSNEPLSKIIQWFKTMTTNAYIKGVKEGKFLPFYKKL